MASCLLNCELVDISQKLYRMTWWATALNQISAPGNMTMCGGSKAIITDSSGVKTYFYNESTSSWKLYEGSASEISALEAELQEVRSQMPVIKYGYSTVGNVAANTATNFDITFDESFPGQPIVMTTAYTIASGVMDNGLVEVCVTAKTATGASFRIYNNSATQRNVAFYWLAIYQPE